MSTTLLYFLRWLFYVLFVLCRSVCVCVCKCVLYCTTATGWLPKCSQQIYHIIRLIVYKYLITFYLITFII